MECEKVSIDLKRYSLIKDAKILAMDKSNYSYHFGINNLS